MTVDDTMTCSVYDGVVLLQAVLGLSIAGKIRNPSMEFDSEEVRYFHRFQPFSTLVTPPLVQYAQYLVSGQAAQLLYPTGKAPGRKQKR